MKQRQMPGWLRGSLIVGAFVGLWLLERRRPLRASVESKLGRNVRNLAVASVAALALRLVEQPVVGPLTALVTERRWGLLKLVRLPQWLDTALAVVLLDYTLYVWHVLTHRVPALWRFHVVHHADLDLDASTALRFHFGELIISTGWRAAQVLLLGIGPRALARWQHGLMLSILFHHSNVRLPLALERKLSRVVVTPRLHGIHHSVVRAETDANWSSGLTLWDWLHGTLRLDVPQAAITIGVPTYRTPAAVGLSHMLALPFTPQRPLWIASDAGQAARSTRAPRPAAAGELRP